VDSSGSITCTQSHLLKELALFASLTAAIRNALSISLSANRLPYSKPLTRKSFEQFQVLLIFPPDRSTNSLSADRLAYWSDLKTRFSSDPAKNSYAKLIHQRKHADERSSRAPI